MKLTATATATATTRKSQHERLQDEYIEHRRYGEYGDRCDGDYCNQCPDLGTDGCMKCDEGRLYINTRSNQTNTY